MRPFGLRGAATTQKRWNWVHKWGALEIKSQTETALQLLWQQLSRNAMLVQKHPKTGTDMKMMSNPTMPRISGPSKKTHEQSSERTRLPSLWEALETFSLQLILQTARTQGWPSFPVGISLCQSFFTTSYLCSEGTFDNYKALSTCLWATVTFRVQCLSLFQKQSEKLALWGTVWILLSASMLHSPCKMTKGKNTRNGSEMEFESSIPMLHLAWEKAKIDHPK